MRPRYLVALLLALTLTLSACTGSRAPAGGGAATRGAAQQPPLVTAPATLRVALTFSANTLDPIKSGFIVMRTGIAETLFRIDPQGEVEPWLAHDYTRPDAHTWHITIRPDRRFHNGDPVDAAAVKASLERALTESPLAPGLLRSERMEARDDQLVIVTAEPHPGLINNLAHPILAIVHADLAAELQNGFGLRPVLTGPYRVKEFQPGHAVTVERNPHYGEEAPLAEIEFRFITDPNTRALALQAGEVQIATNIPIETIPAIERQGDLRVASAVGMRLKFIHFNTRKPPFDDARVRRAVSLAIDREALASSIMMGFAEPATGLFPPSLPYGNIPAAGSADRQAEARRLLETAGWTETGAGARAKDGTPLSVTLLSYPQRPMLNVLAEVIQAQLAAIGMTVHLRVVQDISAAVSKADYDFTLWNHLTAPVADPLFMLDTWFRSGAPDNYMGYSNPAVDELVARMAAAFEPVEQYRLAQQVQQILLADSPIAALLYPEVVVGLQRDVQGFTVHPLDYYLIDSRVSLGRP